MVGAWALHALSLTLECSASISDKYARQALSLVASLYHREDSGVGTPFSSERPPLMVSLGRVCCSVVSTVGMELVPQGPEISTVHAILSMLESVRGRQESLMAAMLTQQLIVVAKSPATGLLRSTLQAIQSESPDVRLMAVKGLRQATLNWGVASVSRDLLGCERLLLRVIDSDGDAGVVQEAMGLVLHMASSCAEGDAVGWFHLCKEVRGRVRLMGHSAGCC